jgi:hypothetical protein
MKHKHHIVPRHAGGTDHPSNLIEVSIEEHAELHLARYLSFGEQGDWWAFMGLSGQMGKEEILAEKCKSWLGKERSEETKLKMRKPHGPKHTAESRAKISAARKGKKLNPDHKAKISKSLEGNQRSLGKTLTQDHKDKLSKAMKGNQNAQKK